MTLPALAVVLTLGFTDSYGPLDAELTRRSQQEELRSGVGAHAWTLASAGLSAVSTGLFGFGVAYVAHEAHPDADLTAAVFGFALTSLTTAIFMTLYNALL